MGWSSGTSLVRRVIKATMANVEDSAVRQRLYVEIIRAFEDADWDNVDEAMGDDPAFDDAVRTLYPDWFNENGEFI